jgi:hypothetical protein
VLRSFDCRHKGSPKSDKEFWPITGSDAGESQPEDFHTVPGGVDPRVMGEVPGGFPWARFAGDVEAVVNPFHSDRAQDVQENESVTFFDQDFQIWV